LKRWISCAAILSAALAVGVTLIVTSSGGAASTPSQYQRPSEQAVKAAKAQMRSFAGAGKAYAAVLCCGDGLIFATGFKDIQHVGDGIWCFYRNGRPSGPAIPTEIWPLDGPGAVAWDVFNTNCPEGYYEIRAYDLDTGAGAEWISFQVWVP
jgi:hypothetical protein